MRILTLLCYSLFACPSQNNSFDIAKILGINSLKEAIFYPIDKRKTLSILGKVKGPNPFQGIIPSSLLSGIRKSTGVYFYKNFKDFLDKHYIIGGPFFSGALSGSVESLFQPLAIWGQKIKSNDLTLKNAITTTPIERTYDGCLITIQRQSLCNAIYYPLLQHFTHKDQSTWEKVQGSIATGVIQSLILWPIDVFKTYKLNAAANHEVSPTIKSFFTGVKEQGLLKGLKLRPLFLFALPKSIVTNGLIGPFVVNYLNK